MENCVVREITYIDEYIELCEIASKSKHPNAKNYDVAQMKKRWNKYLIIHFYTSKPSSLYFISKVTTILIVIISRTELYHLYVFYNNQVYLQLFYLNHTIYVNRILYEITIQYAILIQCTLLILHILHKALTCNKHLVLGIFIEC